jgi:site-specific recombinase XerD
MMITINFLRNIKIEVNNKQRRLEPILEDIIQSLEPSRSKSTVDNYRTALRSFIGFAGRDITTRRISARTMEAYQRWLKQRGVCPNTSSCYMRSLRKLFHEADIQDSDRLFKNVFTGNAKTEKRAITTAEVTTLQRLKIRSMVRDLFLFSFFAMGMPFIDLAFLRKNQAQNGYITYCRHKTGQTIHMKIEPPMQEIINMYAREDTPYLFPILTATEPRAAMRQYERQRHRYNRQLKRLAAKAGIPRLTSYVVRHTWASIARDLGADIPVIQKALGHQDIKTTQIYLSEVNDHRVYDTNAAVIAKIFPEMLGS